VSNALEISNLKSKAGTFFLWYALARLRTNMKLSYMLLRLMNAFCALEMRLSICFPRRMARVFVMSLPNEWIRLIGL
jgi:hypothetical protein